jgi:hypothetical protein
VLLEETRQQIPPRDLDFLLHRVTGDLDDLHAVAERRRNVEEIVRRADEEARREIERHIEVVIDELVVLRRVEDLEHGRGGVTRRAAPRHLVDLVDHQDGVADLHSPKGLNE